MMTIYSSLLAALLLPLSPVPLWLRFFYFHCCSVLATNRTVHNYMPCSFFVFLFLYILLFLPAVLSMIVMARSALQGEH